MVTLNLTAVITDGKVVHFTIDPGFTHEARVIDKQEFYDLKSVLTSRIKRFMKRDKKGN